MNLRFVEAFLWVARLKSFKAAAEQMHTTQAAISGRIATLEEELGTRLFERDNRSVKLTHRGAGLIPLAEQMLDLAAQMRQTVVVKETVTGTLRVGAIETVVHTCLPGLLSRFSRLYPQVTVELHCDITPFLCDELLKGRLDVVLASEEVTEGFVENRRMAELPMRWVAAPSLALPEGTLDFASIAHLPLLTFHKQSIICKNVVQIGARRPLRLNCLSSLAAMISLAKTGFGIATLPPQAIREETRTGSLRVLDVHPVLQPLPIVSSIQAGNASSVAEDFARLAQEACDDYLRTNPA